MTVVLELPPGVEAQVVAEATRKQRGRGCRCQTTWWQFFGNDMVLLPVAWKLTC